MIYRLFNDSRNGVALKIIPFDIALSDVRKWFGLHQNPHQTHKNLYENQKNSWKPNFFHLIYDANRYFSREIEQNEAPIAFSLKLLRSHCVLDKLTSDAWDAFEMSRLLFSFINNNTNIFCLWRKTATETQREGETRFPFIQCLFRIP